MANPGLSRGYMFKRRFWQWYGFIGALFAGWGVGRLVMREIDSGMESYKHKSMLFKDVKIPPGEDFWNR